MTIDKERLRVLAEAATPGPWDSSAELVAIVGGPLFVTNLARGGTRSIVCRIENEVSQRTLDSEDHANAELIAAARDAIPALLSENAALAAEVERLRKDAGRVDAYIKFMRDNAFNPELHAHETRDLLETCKRLEEWRSGIND